jgi:hypothetical protein
MIGDHYKATGPMVIALGVIVAVFGLLPGGKFFTHYPTLHGIVKKPVSDWSGRIWFLAGGALLIYWGLTHGGQ